MRLAYERGLLSKKNPSKIQHLALLYWIYLERRTKKEEERSFLAHQLLHLDPARWVEMGYRDELMAELGISDEVQAQTAQGADVTFTAEDEDAIEQFLRQQDQIAAKRWISAGLLPPDFVPDTHGTPV